MFISEGLMVGCDGWHEHFDAADEALRCFAFAFSQRCRLRVTYRGTFACKWSLEALQPDGRWEMASTTGLLLVPFWRAARAELLQNWPLPDC